MATAVATALDTFGQACTYTPGDGSDPYTVTAKVSEGIEVDARVPSELTGLGFNRARYGTVLVMADDLAADPVAGSTGQDNVTDANGTEWHVRAVLPEPPSLRGVAWKLFCSAEERVD
jgi:hypothetical protein